MCYSCTVVTKSLLGDYKIFFVTSVNFKQHFSLGGWELIRTLFVFTPCWNTLLCAKQNALIQNPSFPYQKDQAFPLKLNPSCHNPPMNEPERQYWQRQYIWFSSLSLNEFFFWGAQMVSCVPEH